MLIGTEPVEALERTLREFAQRVEDTRTKLEKHKKTKDELQRTIEVSGAVCSFFVTAIMI